MGEGLEFGDFKVEDEFVENTVPEDVVEETTLADVVDEGPSEDPEAPIEIAYDEFGNPILSPEDRLRLINEMYPLPEDFPSEEQIDAWEAEFGRIRVRRVAAHEAYVVRALTRAEFRQYLAILKAKFGNGTVDPTEERMVQEELLVERCTLWPKVTGADIRGESKPLHKIGLAGTASVLSYDIQEISNLIETNVGPFQEV